MWAAVQIAGLLMTMGFGLLLARHEAAVRSQNRTSMVGASSFAEPHAATTTEPWILCAWMRGLLFGGALLSVGLWFG